MVFYDLGAQLHGNQSIQYCTYGEIRATTYHFVQLPIMTLWQHRTRSYTLMLLHTQLIENCATAYPTVQLHTTTVRHENAIHNDVITTACIISGIMMLWQPRTLSLSFTKIAKFRLLHHYNNANVLLFRQDTAVVSTYFFYVGFGYESCLALSIFGCPPLLFILC